MKIEHEATFPNIDKKLMRQKLKRAGARLVRPEFLQKRVVFFLPKGHEIKGAWLRVRDERDKITMSLKVDGGRRIHDQKELCLEINDFGSAVQLLESIGCRQKAYQETKRELWKLAGAEITIDTWPWLEPLMEVEGATAKIVQSVCRRIGLDFAAAWFCPIGTIYSRRYGFSPEVINDQTPLIVFKGRNPFIRRKK